MATGAYAAIYCGADVLALTGADPAADPKAPDVIVIPTPGVIYDGSTTQDMQHGGNSQEDRRIPLVVAGGPVKAASRAIVPSQIAQVAPTVLRALGLDPAQLQGAAAEGTTPLPGLFCVEAGPAPAACPAPPPERCATHIVSDPAKTGLQASRGSLPPPACPPFFLLLSSLFSLEKTRQGRVAAAAHAQDAADRG